MFFLNKVENLHILNSNFSLKDSSTLNSITREKNGNTLLTATNVTKIYVENVVSTDILSEFFASFISVNAGNSLVLNNTII